MEQAGVYAQTVIQATGLIAMPTKRIQLKPQPPHRQVLLARTEFIGLYGHMEGRSDVERDVFLVAPDATWSDLHAAVQPAYDNEPDDILEDGIHRFWVRPDCKRTVARRTRTVDFMSGNRVTGKLEQALGGSWTRRDIDGETAKVSDFVGSEGFAMLTMCCWSRDYLVAITFFDCGRQTVDRVGKETGNDMSLFNVNGDGFVKPPEHPWYVHRDGTIEFRSAEYPRLSERKGDKARLAKWMEERRPRQNKTDSLQWSVHQELRERDVDGGVWPSWEEMMGRFEAEYATKGHLPSEDDDPEVHEWLLVLWMLFAVGELSPDRIEELDQGRGIFSRFD